MALVAPVTFDQLEANLWKKGFNSEMILPELVLKNVKILMQTAYFSGLSCLIILHKHLKIFQINFSALK